MWPFEKNYTNDEALHKDVLAEQIISYTKKIFYLRRNL